MGTLELDRTATPAREASQAMPASPAMHASARMRDCERENAEDLALFREFLMGRPGEQSFPGKQASKEGPSSSDVRSSREAFTKIYLRYRERVYAYALRVLSNEQDAEDLFQEVFYRVYTRAERFTEEKSLGGWIFTIAHNLCLNKVRDRKPQCAIDDLVLPSEEGDAHSSAYDAFIFDDRAGAGDDWQEVIARAMALLPIEYREVIILREYEGMSYAEITGILHTTIPSVKSRLYRAKGRLRELLAPYYREK